MNHSTFGSVKFHSKTLSHFFFQRKFRDYLSDHADCILERAPLNQLAKDTQLSMYPHKGFWQPMDTLRDKTFLESLLAEKKAPWLREGAE